MLAQHRPKWKTTLQAEYSCWSLVPRALHEGLLVGSEVVGDTDGQIVGLEVVGEGDGDVVGSEVVSNAVGDIVGDRVGG